MRTDECYRAIDWVKWHNKCIHKPCPTRATERYTNHIVTTRDRLHNDTCVIIQGGGVDTVSPKKVLDIANVFLVGLRGRFSFR